MKNLKHILSGIFYTFPVRLLGLHFKKNQVLLLFWFVLFSVITGSFGRSMGVPQLFLDPEYMDKVNFTSYFIMGVVIAGFSISFIITAYILDSQRFNFLGWLSRPFSRFSINNLPIPLVFLTTYSWQVIKFQRDYETSTAQIAFDVLGILTGFVFMTFTLFVYFRLTNKDIFKFMVCKLDEKLRENVRVTRAASMSKLLIARKKQVRVDSFLDFDFKIKKVPDYGHFYDKSTVLRVFDQNHFNLITVELLIFAMLLVFGIFSEIPYFQLPAAASAMLLLTILIMFTGAFSFWFRGWSVSLTILILLCMNLLIKYDVVHKDYRAFGLDYDRPPKVYSLDSLIKSNNKEHYEHDRSLTIKRLENWKARVAKEKKPVMVFVCASGGGQRAMLWSLNAMQRADSITGNKLMDHTVMMTGASGGLIGISYYRELVLRQQTDSSIRRDDRAYLWGIARDNLNPVIFSLLVNDIFLGFQKFTYEGHQYIKDRGYAFEQQLNRNTLGFMDKNLYEYFTPVYEGKIPMVLMAPTVINDGRKLYISSMPVSYMNVDAERKYGNRFVLKGIEFNDFFKDHNASGLRFISGLRMSATFPYITPNITLPTVPKMEIMDAGLTDNFGISDAVMFLYHFKDWIAANTSAVLFVSVRDSQKHHPVNDSHNQSLFQKFSSPIEGVYKNFENIQDINNDTYLERAQSWYKGPLYTVNLEYNSANNVLLKERASLNWRLTNMEKNSIIQNINSKKNRAQLEKLKEILE